MMDLERRPAPSPWHAGERAMHAHLGVAEKMEGVGRRRLLDHMPDQHRTFYGQLPFVLLGAVDAAGAPWASVVEGPPGFASSPDPYTLRIESIPGEGDPAREAVVSGAAVGLLGIELHTRRRNRMNGRIVRRSEGGFDVTVEQAFGNCPQYIRLRDFSFARPPSEGGGGAVERGAGLDEEARTTVTAADTFFVASYADVDGDVARRQVDVSHRGGDPGFVRVSGDVMTIPDFAGNLHFNTLGNLLANPRAGLVFVDFERGDVLQLTGRAEVVLEGEEIAAFPGAQRLWRFTALERVRRRDGLSLRWRSRE